MTRTMMVNMAKTPWMKRYSDVQPIGDKYADAVALIF